MRTLRRAGRSRIALLGALGAPLIVIIPTSFAIWMGWPRAVVSAILALTAVGAGVCTWLAFHAAKPDLRGRQEKAMEIERRHAALVEEHSRTQADLEMARAMQRAFLPDPRRRPLPRHLNFAHVFRPAMAVGGDYYDLKLLDDHRLALILADVSGHGMAAAFVTGLIKTTFEFSLTPNHTASQFMAHLNNVLERLTPTHSFAAVVFGIYDVREHALLFVNAGHNPTPVVVRTDRRIEPLDQPVDLLAGVNPDIAYQEGRALLAPGDKLVLCTDGLIDASDDQGQRFGLARFHETLARHAALPAAELLEKLTEELDSHASGGAPQDDLSLLIMEVLK